jgi:hypothetical protein
LGYGAATAIALTAFSYTGGKLGGLVRDKDVDEVSRKEEIRKNRRRPLEETINELGEGRGTNPIPKRWMFILPLYPKLTYIHDRHLRSWLR